MFFALFAVGCSMATVAALKQELETYELHRSSLLSESEGKFVLIHGDEVAGVWPTYREALKTGYERYGLQPFLVKQIELVESVQVFTRDIS
jgi:hypothetical protein